MTTGDGLLARVALKVRQGVCGLHGHDALLHFNDGRMSLLCSSCGHETPGWDLAGNNATDPTVTGTSVRPAAVHVRYAERRAA